jgi:ribokinase
MSSSTNDAPFVVVFGSTNLDVAMQVQHLPRPGETVVATRVTSGPGGKGGNQAMAVARAAVSVRLLSAVGSDDAGEEVLAALTDAGVDTGRVLRHRSAATGRAHITVDAAGENEIVIAAGANAALTAEFIEQATDVITTAQLLVVQGEAPVEATRAAVRIARDHGTRVIANLAPYIDLGALVAIADPLVVNELEASELLGVSVTDVGSVERAAQQLSGIAASVVVTLGAAGAALCRAGSVTVFPARAPERVVDTTGAGDAFVGVLAAALANGSDLDSACGAAIGAATRTVERVGAAAAYPRFSLPDAPIEVPA